MNQEVLHGKVIDMAKRNKKALTIFAQHIFRLKKESEEEEKAKLNDYYRKYPQLLKLNQESKEEAQRMSRQLDKIDHEIEQLEIKNTMSRSRIKQQSEEIEIIRDEASDIDKIRRREQKIERNNEQIKRQTQRLEEQIKELENQFEQRRKTNAELQANYQALIEKRENLNSTRKERHKKHKAKMEQLQQKLRELKHEATTLQLRKEREEEKTKRNNRKETLDEIKDMLRRHKEAYQ